MKKFNTDIGDFLRLKSFAIIGVSAKKKKFGNVIFKQLLRRGFNVHPIHKEAMLVEGEPCYPNFDSLPEKPEGIILVVHPEETEKIVKEAASEGIKYIWMQQGAESVTAVKYCISHGIKVISKECLLMFLEKPGFPHNFHKWASGYR